MGSNYERVGYGESPTMKPLMKNTFEQLTEKSERLSRLRRRPAALLSEGIDYT